MSQLKKTPFTPPCICFLITDSTFLNCLLVDHNKSNKDKCMFLLYLHVNAVNNNKGGTGATEQTSGLAMEFSIKVFSFTLCIWKILLVLKWFLFTSKLSFFFFFFPHLIGTVCHSRNSGSEELVSINCWVRVLECIFNWSWFVSFTPSSVCMRIFYLFSLLRLLRRIFNNSKKTVDCLLLMINSEYSKTFLRDLQN